MQARVCRPRLCSQQVPRDDLGRLLQRWQLDRRSPRFGLRHPSRVRPLPSLSANEKLTDPFAHSASILLHEPFCDKADRSPHSSIARCLTSAKAVVNSTYVLYQSSNDLCGIDPCVLLSSPSARSNAFDAASSRTAGPSSGAPSCEIMPSRCTGAKSSRPNSLDSSRSIASRSRRGATRFLESTSGVRPFLLSSWGWRLMRRCRGHVEGA